MKKALTIGLAVTALAATLSLVAAGSSKREPAIEAGALPASAILATLRSTGLNPIGEPVRRGLNYVMHAYDPRGLEVRVVVDAHFGDILSITPTRMFSTAYAPNYQRGARIIHVPPRGEGANDGASIDDRDESAASNDDDIDETAPSVRRHVAPPDTRRTVLSAPPPPMESPAPRLDSNSGLPEKFEPPRDPPVTSSVPPPPPGYTPPAALPHSD